MRMREQDDRGRRRPCRKAGANVSEAIKRGKKGLAALLLSLTCALALPGLTYAQEAVGPASDPGVAVQQDQATGPASGQPENGQGTATGQPESDPGAAADQPQTDPGTASGQPENGQGTASGQPENGQGTAAGQSETDPGAAAGQPQTDPGTASGQPESDPGEASVQPDGSGLVASGGRYLDPEKPMVALTFDDGPYAPVGNRIMDCAEQYGGRVTFFVVGNRVNSYQTEIRRMHDNGHEIGNHTYEHKYLNKLNGAQIRAQIDGCNQAVAAVTGEAPRLVRLPGGNKNSTVLANISQPIIMWNIDTLDWKTRNAAQSVQTVLSQVKDGDVVLMHELYTQSGDAACAIIPALVEQGYQLVTVSELAQFRGGVQNGGLYYSFRR